MELRAYLDILRRRWLVIVLLPALVALLVAYLDQTRSTGYTAEARVSITRISEATTETEYEYDDYYDLLATEFIVDDTVEIVRGNVFAAAVSERLIAEGIGIGPEEVDSALSASREHRQLSITATTNDHGRSIVIANMAAAEIDENINAYVGPATSDLPLTVRPVQVPVNADSDTLRVRATFILAVIVAGGFGLLLALLLEYFDDALDESSAPTATGLELLGVVPGEAR